MESSPGKSSTAITNTDLGKTSQPAGTRGKRICFVTAIPLTVEAFLIDYIRSLETFCDVTVITNVADTSFLGSYGLKARVISLPIKREIAPFHDLYALGRLFLAFTKHRFSAVHSITPKAGLLAMVASRLAQVPVRIHTFTGQVWATKSGAKRWFLKKMDRVIVRCATHVLADSFSQREFIVNEGIVMENKVHVIGHGSICGVDMERFSPDPQTREEVRKKMGIGSRELVFLFLGRLNREKGILDLLDAFRECALLHDHAHLVLVGPDEENMQAKIEEYGQSLPHRIHYEGTTRSPERYMMAADCLCLPSYREGFGLVIIEAAACEIPAIGSNIYGIVDAIEDRVTGLLHRPGDVKDLARCLRWMMENEKERILMGKRARKRVESLFRKEHMLTHFTQFYQAVLNARG